MAERAPIPASMYPVHRGVSLLRPTFGRGAHAAALGAALARPSASARWTVDVSAPSSPVEKPAAPTASLLAAVVIVAGFLVAGVLFTVLGAPFTKGGASSLWTVFITGLTTGGLSCLAVQGGLLATSLKSKSVEEYTSHPERIIGSFLITKLLAYTVLGALLGLFGSVAQLSVTTRGFMQFAIGLFMVLTAVRMIRPYRWLNFVVIEPPPVARRFIRRISRQDEGLATPMFLGALTVLIPCGVTQAMMAIAITTASPIAGAITMALFVIGTSPMFFVLSYVASSIGRHAEAAFNRIVAVLILILGYVAIQSGAVLVGHPLPIRPLFTNLAPKTAVVSAAQTGGLQAVDVTVHVDGYTPNNVRFQAGKAGRIVFVTDHITGCTRTLNIPSLNLQQPLKVTGRTDVTIPARPAGTKLQWVCGMGMFTGTITFK